MPEVRGSARAGRAPEASRGAITRHGAETKPIGLGV